ncbi:S-layer homology domain-containing protein [Sporobacter termitidis]|uniref:S-layer homology domain-containing protein n=1 Tax=Sporobacter termitidis TaxID=44749 RepID=UPI000932118B|nr:S-layer homology domain-containing protein [Sporobacter termitidis]
MDADWNEKDVPATGSTITVDGSGGATKTQLTAPALSETPASVTADSITLAAPGASAQDGSAALEYHMSSNSGSSYGDWQTSETFSGLTAGTTYMFQARYVAADTENFTNSDASAAVSIATVTGGATQTQLTAPTLSATPAGVTANSITLAAPGSSAQDGSAALEYRAKIHGGTYGAWQDSPVFTGLTANTMYHFQARYVAGDTESFIDSAPSAEVGITTNASTAPTGTYTSGALTVNYFANYGGEVTVSEETGEFTITAIADGYVIDTVCVDGVPMSGMNDPNGKTSATYTFAGDTTGTHSIVAAYAYTLSFNAPDNGTLSVIRGSETLTSGDIVHGGDVLTITATPDDGYVLDALTLAGLHDNGDGTYTVYGTAAPSIYVSFKTQGAAAPAPVIGTQPAGGTFEVKSTVELSVTASAESGTLSYQWYRSDDNTTETPGDDFAFPNGTNSTYAPSSASPGTFYYYCVVKNTLDGGTASVKSDIAAVTIAAPSGGWSINSKRYGGSATGYTYSITVNGVVKGTGLLPNTELLSAAKEGDIVTITPTYDAGYGLDKFNLNVSPYTANADGSFTFTMINNDASFSIKVKTAKTIEIVPPAHGTVAATTEAGFETYGGTITVTATPDEGYRLGYISYSVDGGATWINVFNFTNNVGTISTSAANTMITAVFEESTGAISISNETELRAFAAAVNGGKTYRDVTVSLAQDIALTQPWTPIGTESHPFRGVFEGGVHTVSGMNVQYDTLDTNTRYLGLFGYVNAAVIQNLTVSGAVNAGDTAKNDTTFTYPFAGGLVGYAIAGTQIVSCVNGADVSVPVGTAGGIAGYFGGQMSGCVNSGSVTIRKNNIQAVGGIAGYFSGIMAQCGNYGDVTVVGELTVEEYEFQGMPRRDERTDPFGQAGGVAGYADGTVGECFNKGAVTGWGRNMGGLFGAVGYSAGKTITDSYSTGAVSMTAGGNTILDATVAGLVGLVPDGGMLTLTNCYTTGSIENLSKDSRSKTGALYCTMGTSGAYVTATNCFAAGSAPTASALGVKYQADANNVNGGNPLLWWEKTSTSDDEYPVTFTVTPANANATVKVFTDAAQTHEVTAAGGTFSLKAGLYYYTVTANGFVTENGNFNVTVAAKTVPVALRAAANVTFTVSPSTASLALTTGSKQAVAPVSSNGGVYTFILYAGDHYTYTAEAEGYNGATREFVASSGKITVSLTKSGQSDTDKHITGGQAIESGGRYIVDSGSTGTITIRTDKPVTLIGNGLSTSKVYNDLYIDCTSQATNLTLQDIYISNITGGASNKNMIDFANGAANTLLFEGTSILDMDTGATGYAMVHVPYGSRLTVGGVTPYDTLYFYKKEQGAGIGGNGGADGGGKSPEYNGPIIITGGNFFMKSSKQGALIGSGAQAKSASYGPGDIVIQGGTLNLTGISRAAAIGGSAGSTGAASGANVYIYPNASVNINVDYSGSAIGGGGHGPGNLDGSDGGAGNDADGGILHYYGGSIRTYIDYNAWSDGGWSSAPYNVKAYGVNDTAITADKVDASGKSVYLCALDTSKLPGGAGSFDVMDGTALIYSGELHQYAYINESLHKNNQITVNYTMDNWAPIKPPDSNLYLYLTGADHTLTVNGETVKATWDSTAKTFKLTYPAGGLSAEPASATIDAEADSSGTAKIGAGDITKGIADAIANAAKDGTAPTLAINVKASDSAAKIQAVIPASSFAELAGSQLQSVTVSTPIGAITLDNKALDSVTAQAKGTDVTLGVAKADKKALTKAQQDAAGTGTVFDLSITSGGTAIHDLGGGTATVRLPYTLKDGETAEGIVIWYLDDAGKLTQLEGAKYDAGSGTVIFTAPHFSLFVVGYDLVAAWQNPFTDVAKTAWYYKNVWYASTHGLFKGTSDTTFSPDTPMTRAMFVTVLGRLEGVKESDYTTSSFGDVPTGEWYSAYVEWAVKSGIVTGVGDGLFAPDRSVTREELAAMLYRYATFKKLDVTQASALDSFPDAADVSDWALTAVRWAVSEGLINGMGDGTLSPAATASRAQVAAILERTDENVLK